MMTLQELHDELTDLLASGVDPYTKLHVDQQPSYPLRGDLLGVVHILEEDPEDVECGSGSDKKILTLVSSEAGSYGSDLAWVALDYGG